MRLLAHGVRQPSECSEKHCLPICRCLGRHVDVHGPHIYMFDMHSLDACMHACKAWMHACNTCKHANKAWVHAFCMQSLDAWLLYKPAGVNEICKIYTRIACTNICQHVSYVAYTFVHMYASMHSRHETENMMDLLLSTKNECQAATWAVLPNAGNTVRCVCRSNAGTLQHATLITGTLTYELTCNLWDVNNVNIIAANAFRRRRQTMGGMHS